MNDKKPWWWGECLNSQPDYFGERKHDYVEELKYAVEWIGEETEPTERRARCTTCGDITDVTIFDEPDNGDHRYEGSGF